MKYRELLPVQPCEMDGDNDGIPVVGLYFKHDLMMFRVFVFCAGWVAIAMGIAATRADAAVGWAIGTFLLAVPALFIAVLALVVAVTRR